MAKKNKSSKIGDILKNITKKYIKDTAAKEREKSYDIRKIFEQMELDLISSMRRAFYFHQNEQKKEGFEWEQWQLSKLRAMEQYRARNRKIVSKYNKPIQDAINRELRGNFSKGEGKVEKLFNKINQVLKWRKREHQSIEFPDDIDTSTLKGYMAKELGSPGAIPQEKNFFGVNEKKLEALISTVNNDLNKAQYSVLRKMDDVYRQTIFKTHMYLQNGAKTLNQAIDMSTKDFLDKGINSIEYKNGAKVNISSYAEMALRTANHRAMLLGEGKKRDEYGIHLVVVSAHANTCKMCEPWQGKIVIDDIFSHPSNEYIEKYKDKYKLLSEAIDKGLLHPNCRHALITYFEGITTLPKVQDGKEAIKTYEAEQKQRAYERDIRKWKRIEAGLVDEENKIKAANNVRKLQNKLNKHIKDNPKLRINNN
ncbi:MAG: capsid protein, partial [Clostridium sp.]|uniref:phage minor capsid protein n=1 Tax=Clostridium sp. TaxID=1506 RepID=UPI0025C6A5A7